VHTHLLDGAADIVPPAASGASDELHDTARCGDTESADTGRQVQGCGADADAEDSATCEVTSSAATVSGAGTDAKAKPADTCATDGHRKSALINAEDSEEVRVCVRGEGDHACKLHHHPSAMHNAAVTALLAAFFFAQRDNGSTVRMSLSHCIPSLKCNVQLT
jgi:hypothetical protein